MKATFTSACSSFASAVTLGTVVCCAVATQVSAQTNCATPPSGLVGWWKGENNALDEAGSNNGTLAGNTTFGAGAAGQGFVFDGSTDVVQMGSATNLQLQNFTIEAWVKRDSAAITSHGSYGNAIIFGYGHGGYSLYLDPSGTPALSKIGIDAVTPTATITDTNFHHLAVTKFGSVVVFYIDGVAYSTGAYDPGFVFSTGAAIGARSDNLDNSFLGSIDEVAVYNHALSTAEIQAIYNAGGAGKCSTPIPPFIISQPTDQTVGAGGTATFTVMAGGTPPLNYQWNFNGSALTNATNATLVLTGVDTNQAGSYGVEVTNLYGVAVSSNASLTVLILDANLFDDFDPNVDSPQWSGFGGRVLATNFGGSVSGSNSLWFGGDGSRYAVTHPLNTTGGGLIRFHLRIASGSSYPWEKADLPGEGIVLEYLASSGSSWVEIGRYDTSAYFNWTQISVMVPAGAQAVGAQFRWRQLGNSGASNDHWALDDVWIATGPAPATILTQPQSQTVFIGSTATFGVTASGTLPLSYQWSFNGSALTNATNAMLVLTDVTTNEAGLYAVQVTNRYGVAPSSNAVLTVNPPPLCANPPSGLISWWRGEGNGSDEAGGNNGTLSGSTAFGTGEAGQGFMFDGTADLVQVGSAINLKLQDFTIETWIKRASASIVSYGSFGIGVIFGYGEGGYGLYLDPSGHPALSKIGSSAVSVSASITDTNFHHVAVSKSGSAVVFYIDGVAYAAGAYDPGFVFSTGAAIGARSDNLNNSFLGTIDEVAVYNRALATNELQTIYSAGAAGKCVVAVPPFIITQPTNRTVTAGANVTFNVTAGGTFPLGYQWSFKGASIAAATNASLTLTNVQVSESGNYSVMVTNAAGSATSSNALLTVNFPPAVLRVVSTNAVGGATVIVPIVLVANGNENAVGFSLNFDPSVLTNAGVSLGSGVSNASSLFNTSLVGSGKLGVALALQADATFPAGTQEIAQLSFTVAPLTNATATSLTFGDQPISRELSDASGNILPVTFANGTISVAATDFEGDVSPRPGGNKTVTITDWVLAGRYAARLDYPTNASEFQRADCAPRDTQGNGAITVSDWVQTGRYAAGLDPAAPVGGPTSEGSGPTMALKGNWPAGEPNGPSTTRQVQVMPAVLAQNQTGTVRVNLEAQGNENALGFSLTFDPAVFSYAGATLGSAATGATLNVNTNQLGSGGLGFVLALPIGTNFAAGTREIVKVSLRAAAVPTNGYAVSFTNQPVSREVSDKLAQVLTADYVNGTVIVNPPPSLNITHANQNITLSWPLWASNFAPQVADAVVSPMTWTNVLGTVGVSNNENIVTLPITGSAKFYRLSSP